MSPTRTQPDPATNRQRRGGVVRRRPRTAAETDQPFIVIWEVTRACQLACVHCRARAIPHRDPMELSTDEGKALLDDLAALPAP